jgi:hypothetical protein
VKNKKGSQRANKVSSPHASSFDTGILAQEKRGCFAKLAVGSGLWSTSKQAGESHTQTPHYPGGVPECNNFSLSNKSPRQQ